ncbi:hypothetical protein HPB48_017150 [Haemaphysalis longicornis]|uniref:BESS domain-containing protein n=1 Tax=Haemaphysalis longicornis TaxID=44386 RepID=A0A9J6GCJ1_HAELO|nr:hypothetical protein HPB48_017150 [Haemaphysalis longicornis]
MSKEPAGKLSGEGSGMRKGAPAPIRNPTNPKDRPSTESSTTAPVGRASAGAAAVVGGTREGKTHSSRDQVVAGPSTAPPPDGPSSGPTDHAGKETRRRRHKAPSRHRKKKADRESTREQLDNGSRRESRYDFDDGDDYQTGTAATGYHDDALDNEDDSMSAVTAMLQAASANRTTTCQRPHVDTDDSDTLYLLSLRESFKRLSASQKSSAMIRIQTMLHEIEFGKP